MPAITREQALEMAQGETLRIGIHSGPTKRAAILADLLLSIDQKARSEEMAETARVVDLLAEIRYHVKCDPQMEKSTYTISRTGAQEIGKLLVEFPPRARLGAVIPNPGEME